MKQWLVWLALLLFVLPVWAQEPADSLDTEEDDDEHWVIPAINEQTKLGIKLGSGISTMVGESNHPRPGLLLSGGLYGRFRFAKHWSVQAETNISYRGSNFANGTGAYNSIKCYYIDIPVLLFYGFNEKNTVNIVGGLQYAYLMSASMFTEGSALAEQDEPALNKNDVMVALGSQFHTPFVGFQLLFKYGLLNVDKGLLPNVPPVNTGNPMHNLTFEIGFIF